MDDASTFAPAGASGKPSTEKVAILLATTMATVVSAHIACLDQASAYAGDSAQEQFALCAIHILVYADRASSIEVDFEYAYILIYISSLNTLCNNKANLFAVFYTHFEAH